MRPGVGPGRQACHMESMQPNLDALLDLIEPILDHDRKDFVEAVAYTAGRLRGSGMVARRDASDRDVVVAGLLAYGSLARSSGYEAEGLEEEMEGPLRALLGEEQANALLAEWRGAGRAAARPGRPQ